MSGVVSVLEVERLEGTERPEPTIRGRSGRGRYASLLPGGPLDGREGRAYMIRAPWITLFPGAAIVVCVLGLNLFGDGLRDVLDPRLRGK